jgi:hypothetical protein
MIMKLESSSGSVPTTPSGTISSDITARTETLEKRLDTLNERLLFIETVKGEAVETPPTPEPEAREEIESVITETPPTPEPEAREEIESVITEAPPTPAPVPEIIETLKDVEESIVKEEGVVTQPTRDMPSIPTPGAIPTPAPEGTIRVPTPVAEVPAPTTTPASQITEAVERDVSPISKQVSGTIPTPPSAEEAIQPGTGIQPPAPKTEEVKPPEEGKSAELFGEAVSGDKAELLKALKKLEDL